MQWCFNPQPCDLEGSNRLRCWYRFPSACSTSHFMVFGWLVAIGGSHFSSAPRWRGSQEPPFDPRPQSQDSQSGLIFPPVPKLYAWGLGDWWDLVGWVLLMGPLFGVALKRYCGWKRFKEDEGKPLLYVSFSFIIIIFACPKLCFLSHGARKDNPRLNSGAIEIRVHLLWKKPPCRGPQIRGSRYAT